MASVTRTALPQVELIETDGVPLESPWHWAAIVLLIDSLHFHLRGRSNYFAGGNMFLYYSAEQARNRDYRGPDFFFVDEVDGRKPREWWAVWDEDGRYPDVIMELLSPTTATLDVTVKKRLYERTFHTPEYFCHDPQTHKLQGWRLGSKGRYQAIRPDARGWLWCEGLQLWLGPWTGKHLEIEGVFPRFYDRQAQLVPTGMEAASQQAAAEQQRAEAEKQRAEAEEQRADAEQQRAESEKQRAEAEKQRADQAEAQLARLQAELTGFEPPKRTER